MIRLQNLAAQGAGHLALCLLGMRASLYNAMDMDGVAALIDYMTEFERTKA